MVFLYEVRECLPEGFEALLTDSLNDGYQFLQRLKDEWFSGANCFARPGECLRAACEEDRLIGIGGINIDPYLNDPTRGRIRHLYVHSNFRRKSVASLILRTLEKDAVCHFHTLTLRTNNPEADLFYLKLGFLRVQGHSFVTHQKVLGSLDPRVS
ncbi:acetyltransferase, GNAT family [Gloeobacter kilaueensis JS1]|uniref:Acetyltransferase, GNAT family n=1 Tax=Gloeobacter kilaueensis (strain ATCC BAA-2537 / CCAP 1431/1 / ULC 316 / JS1) TaxID=1183438 RepID=U5QMJ9_GLOK1|nr:acetyltransferase, GNAT family [Gloeobacter kilaueensis JS1]